MKGRLGQLKLAEVHPEDGQGSLAAIINPGLEIAAHAARPIRPSPGQHSHQEMQKGLPGIALK